MSEGLSNAGFEFDLRVGQASENALAAILSEGATIEVKSDKMTRRTGNVFVEYESRGKPSGIATTQAQWWAIEVDDNVFVIMPVDRLRKLFYAAQSERGYVKGGDYNTSKGVLVRASDLLKAPDSGSE